MHPSKRTVIKVSHMVPVEQPEVLGRLIADFLEAPEPPQTTMMPSRRTTH